MRGKLKKIISVLAVPKSPLSICGSTLILKQGFIQHTVELDNIVWFHTHIFSIRYSSKRTVRVILKNKRQKLITFRLAYDIQPILQELRKHYPSILITLDRGATYKKYMQWYRKDFSMLFREK